jgi:hypothetical protein
MVALSIAPLPDHIAAGTFGRNILFDIGVPRRAKTACNRTAVATKGGLASPVAIPSQNIINGRGVGRRK